MFRASLRPSSGAYNCTRSLWFYRWSVVVGAFLVVVCQKRYHLHVKILLRTLVFSHPNTPSAILFCTMQNNLLYSDDVRPTTPSHWCVKISISQYLYKGAYNQIFLVYNKITVYLLMTKWESMNKFRKNLVTAGCLPAVRPATYRIRLICSLWSQNKRVASGLC
jgi:hypothetical protein